MTALQLDPEESSGIVPGIKHRCLRRKSLRTYELLDPKRPVDALSFDVGQIKAIVEMDGRIREGRHTTSVPAGYSEFASRFNEYTTGPERFATLSYVHGKPVTYAPGIPVVWEHFLIDDALVGWNSESSSSLREPTALLSQLPGSFHHNQQPSVSQISDVGKIELPPLRALSAHMKGALETTDQLAHFWIKRGAIEHDYASRLATLAERTMGEKEPSEFRDAIDGFRVEAARQAMNHHTLAMQIALELEARCLNLRFDQVLHWRDVYEPGVKKLEETLLQQHKPQTGISAEWKRQYRNVRHSLDLTRLQSMKKSIQSPFRLSTLSTADPADRDSKRGNYSVRELPTYGREWEALLSSCRKMEVNRSQFMRELLSAFTDMLASVRGSQDESHTMIIRTFDLFRPKEVVEEFHKNFSAVGENHISQNVSKDNKAKQPVQEYSSSPSNIISPRPLPQPPMLIAPPSYLETKGKGKEKEIFETKDIASSSANPWPPGQIHSSHGKNPGMSALHQTQAQRDMILTGPKDTSIANVPKSLPMPSISRSTSLTGNRSIRPTPTPPHRRGDHQHLHPSVTIPMYSAQASRPKLPKLNTQFDS